MPRRKELDEAWKVHDEGTAKGHVELDCEKFAPVLKDKEGKVMKDDTGNELHDFNKMGHSHYNSACLGWVTKYATDHPLPRQVIEVEKVEYEKEPCANCKRLVRGDRLYEESVSGLLVCSRKCEMRIANKTEGKVKDEAHFEKAKQSFVEGRKHEEEKKVEVPARLDTVFSVAPPKTDTAFQMGSAGAKTYDNPEAGNGDNAHIDIPTTSTGAKVETTIKDSSVIEQKIRTEKERFEKGGEAYWGSDAEIAYQTEIFEALNLEFGWTPETDPEANAYFNKATTPEIYAYLLEKVLPRFK